MDLTGHEDVGISHECDGITPCRLHSTLQICQCYYWMGCWWKCVALATQSSRLIPSTSLYIITIATLHFFTRSYIPEWVALLNGGEMLYDNPV